MFKCEDKIVGEIIESVDKNLLLEEMNNRIEGYKRDNLKISFYCIKGVYYLFSE